MLGTEARASFCAVLSAFGRYIHVHAQILQIPLSSGNKLIAVHLSAFHSCKSRLL